MLGLPGRGEEKIHAKGEGRDQERKNWWGQGSERPP